MIQRSGTLSKVLQEYLAKCRRERVVTYEGDEHANAINSLALEGKVTGIEFTAFDGIRRKANCYLSAVQFLKKIGQYNDNVNKTFHVVEYHTK